MREWRARTKTVRNSATYPSEGEHLERRRHRQPAGRALVEAVPGLAEPGELRQHEVQERDNRDHEQAERERAPAREDDARHARLAREAADLGVIDDARAGRRPVPHQAVRGSLAKRPRQLDRRVRSRATGTRARRLEAAHGERQRQTAEQVDDVVLTEVDEREAEQRRVAAADGARHGPALREQQRGHRRGGEVK